MPNNKISRARAALKDLKKDYTNIKKMHKSGELKHLLRKEIKQGGGDSKRMAFALHYILYGRHGGKKYRYRTKKTLRVQRKHKKRKIKRKGK